MEVGAQAAHLHVRQRPAIRGQASHRGQGLARSRRATGHVCDNLETCARKRGERCIAVVVVVGQRSQNTRSALELHVAWITAGEARDVSSRDLGELSSESRCRWEFPLGTALTATSVEIGTSLRSLIW